LQERIRPAARRIGGAEHAGDGGAALEEGGEHGLAEFLLAENGNPHRARLPLVRARPTLARLARKRSNSRRRGSSRAGASEIGIEDGGDAGRHPLRFPYGLTAGLAPAAPELLPLGAEEPALPAGAVAPVSEAAFHSGIAFSSSCDLASLKPP